MKIREVKIMSYIHDQSANQYDAATMICDQAATITRLQDKISRLESENCELRRTSAGYRDNMNKLRKQLIAAQNQRDSYKRTIEQDDLQATLDASKKALADVINDRTKAYAKINEQKKRIAELEADTTAAVIASHHAAVIADLESANNKLADRVRELEEQLSLSKIPLTHYNNVPVTYDVVKTLVDDQARTKRLLDTLRIVLNGGDRADIIRELLSQN